MHFTSTTDLLDYEYNKDDHTPDAAGEEINEQNDETKQSSKKTLKKTIANKHYYTHKRCDIARQIDHVSSGMGKSNKAKCSKCTQFYKELATATIIEEKLLEWIDNNTLHHIIQHPDHNTTRQELEYLLKEGLGYATNKNNKM